MRSKSAAPIQTPSQARHSSIETSPSVMRSRAPRHAGQVLDDGSEAFFENRVPHLGQNAEPWNINAKHCGQLIVARRARQYAHREASESAAAPQFGQ